MIQPSKHIFVKDHDASVQQTFDPKEQCLNYGWILQILKSGTDGNGKILIEQSQDGSNWYCYIDSNITSDNIEDSQVLIDDDVFAITDEFFHGFYYRVTYFPNGTTTGTIDISLSQKIRS